MSHKCKAAVVHCIDFRFQEAINSFINNKYLNGNIDRICLAGAVKNLDTMFEQLSISKDLHQVEEIYLINHQDCGAYGARVAENKENELATHTKDLLSAKKFIQEKYPQLNIHIYFLTLEKEFKEIN